MCRVFLIALLGCHLLLDLQAQTIIAHRGNHVRSPENSVESLAEAIRVGSHYVEIDLRTTRDGELVIMHDATVDRTTDGKGAVRNLTMSQIRSLKLQPAPPSGTHRVPMLADILQHARGKTRIYLDFKDADVAQTLKVLKQFRMDTAVVVYINHTSQFVSWRQQAPHIPLIVSLPDSVNSVAKLEQFLNVCDAEILDGDWAGYTRELVQFAHQRHRKIWADIQSQSENQSDWDKALALDLDGLQTDHPEGLRQYLLIRKN